MSDDLHYLKKELYERLSGGAEIFDFLRAGCLDGIWYWDLTDRKHEWMSPEFWTTLGYDPSSMEHLCSEWQDIIFSEDLPLVAKNFHQHCEDPSVPYDQIVRYRHEDGSTVWIRCRGIAIRDDEGRPIRMLGVHQDLTALKRAEEELEVMKARLELANAQLVEELEEVTQKTSEPTSP